MPVGRVSVRSLGVMLCVGLLATLLPAAALAAPAGPARDYIVTLSVAGADKQFTPGSRVARYGVRNRAARTRAVTDRLASQHGFRTGHRFERSVSGFSARLTPQQVAAMAVDDKVATIRPARRFTPAVQDTPRGIQRVKAAPPPGAPGPDIDVDIAVLDTGIGPVGGGELNIAGGINCTDDPENPVHPNYDPDDWADSISSRHGTHVAGTAAARDNGIGTVGVAPGARLWAVRVFEGAAGSEATIVCGLLWAISTHDGPDAPPGTQPIDVINMSIQGPRGTIVEACPGAPGDIIHEAICDAVDAGITVVVAAGNSAINTRRVSPAGYDQVITVGALSDFDGVGWGASSSDCPFYAKDKDDAYATYSNFGKDVDILAPGTCVVSTNTSGDGEATRTLTGTSMATPHVAGAVARYLATHPGTSPAQMAKLVRAAGRMDWDPKSDRYWSGVLDRDEPNRVLDVEALMGAADVRVWLFRNQFNVGTKQTKRTTRVDIQRVGGYDGTVELEIDGLTSAIGSASFKSASLAGLSGLGTNVELSLKLSAPEGQHDLSVIGQGPSGNPRGSRALGVKIDRTGPSVGRLQARLRGSNAPVTGRGIAQTIVMWDGSDALSKVASMTLQRKAGNTAWKRVGTTTDEHLRVSLERGRSNLFRVNAVDSLGNKSQSSVVSARLHIRDSDSSTWTQPASGGWRNKRVKNAQGGSLLIADRPAAGLTTTFSGKSFAVVAPVGPGRGELRVRVDGGPWEVVSLKANKAVQKRAVMSRLVEDGQHLLEIEGYQGPTAVDAVLILR